MTKHMKLKLKTKKSASRKPGTTKVKVPPNLKKALRQMKRPTSVPIAMPYKSALVKPFAPSSLGATVPDDYLFPVTTSHITSTAIINTGNNGTGSVATCILLPNPMVSLLFPTNIFNGTNGYLGSTSMTSLGTNGIAYGAMTDTTLAARSSAMRVVSWGAKLKNIQSFNNITGRVIFTPFVIPEVRYNQVDLIGLCNNTTTSDAMGSSLFTALIGSANPSFGATLSLPGSFEVSMDELISREVQLGTRPMSEAAVRFHTAAAAGTVNNGTYNLGGDGDYYSISTGLTSTGGTSTASSCDNYIGWLVSVIGAPVNAPALDLEIIFHMEEQPKASSGVPVSSQRVVRSKGDMNSTLKAIGLELLGRIVTPENAIAAGGMLARMAGK